MKNNMRLIAVVLGEENSKIRNSETMSLLDYGFMNTRFNLLKKSGQVVKKIRLDKSSRSMIDVSLKNDLGVVELVDDKKHNYKYNIALDNFKLPIKAGSTIGKIMVLENDKEISSADLILKNDVKELSFMELFYSSIKSIVSGQL